MAANFLPPSKLISAIRSGDLPGVIDALNNGGNLEEPDIHGFVGLPLRTACFEGNVEIVLELLNRGANINAMAGDGANAPMRLAQRGKHQDITALLIERGATANSPPAVLAEPSTLFPAQHTPAQEPPTASIRELTDTKPEPEIQNSSMDESIKTTTAFASADNLIEYTPTSIPAPAIEELDLTACYGVDTNLLDFDLQRLQVEQDARTQPLQTPEATKPKSKFWNSGTDK